MFNSKNKNKNPICKNCRLFDPANSECSVLILYEGEKQKIPVEPDDVCFFLQKEDLTPLIQEVKWWVEDPKTGEKVDKDGIVKIEYPEGFFGDENLTKNL